MPDPAEQAKAVGDYWEGHPKPPDEPASAEAQAAYEQDLAAWEDGFGPDGPPEPPEPPAIPGPPTPGAGMPAARLGDLTAHGGTVGPVVTGLAAGVFVGYTPAACMGDAHICPMFDGPKPHVGGTIIKGSLSVMIANKPAARVSDLTECKGPPGQVALGELTVMIGDQGTPYGGSPPAGAVSAAPLPELAGSSALAPGGAPGAAQAAGGGPANIAARSSGPPARPLSPRERVAETAFKQAAANGTPLVDRCEACAKV